VRKRRAAERRSAGLAELAERLDVLSDGLGDAVERARADSLRARTVGSLDRFVELDEALARCAEAAASLPSVDLAVARVEVDGVPWVATAGSEGPPAGSSTTRTAVAVPLEVDGRRLGSLTVYGRTGAPPVPGEELDALQAISHRSAPVIGAARRHSRIELTPVRESPVELGDRELFHETLALFAARARRQGSRLTVCVLDLDDFRLVNDRIGSAAGDRVIAEVAKVLQETVGPTDLACRTGGDEFAVALPGSGRIEAESLLARVQATLARSPAVCDAKVGVTAGIAELEADDDGVSLFERAVAALRRSKSAAKGTAA
jgi:diguanylate cyclase (GGDEF)-like protein